MNDLSSRDEYRSGGRNISIDINAGIFQPMGELGGGMKLGYMFGLNTGMPAHDVMKLFGLSRQDFFRDMDLGLHLSYITGKSSKYSGDTISFLPFLLDVYFRIPYAVDRFRFFGYTGIGLTWARTSVNRASGSKEESSIDFTFRPGLGAMYQAGDRYYFRMDLGYYIMFESVVGMGLSATIGAGYRL